MQVRGVGTHRVQRVGGHEHPRQVQWLNLVERWFAELTRRKLSTNQQLGTLAA
jgi:hypothetical protein